MFALKPERKLEVSPSSETGTGTVSLKRESGLVPQKKETLESSPPFSTRLAVNRAEVDPTSLGPEVRILGGFA